MNKQIRSQNVRELRGLPVHEIMGGGGGDRSIAIKNFFRLQRTMLLNHSKQGCSCLLIRKILTLFKSDFIMGIFQTVRNQ